jgi:hypothetical protein
MFRIKQRRVTENLPVRIGDRDYDNSRHKSWDTYFIPTVSVGYSW